MLGFELTLMLVQVLFTLLSFNDSIPKEYTTMRQAMGNVRHHNRYVFFGKVLHRSIPNNIIKPPIRHV